MSCPPAISLDISIRKRVGGENGARGGGAIGSSLNITSINVGLSRPQPAPGTLGLLSNS